MTAPTPALTRRHLVAAAMIGIAGLAFAVANRPVREDPEARAAFAEYEMVCDARDRAAGAAREAKELGGGQAAVDAERLAGEAGEHAERLRREWAGRWGQLGFGAR